MQSAPTTFSPPSGRALVPREHGAYGQLAMPLLTALAIGRPGLASVTLSASVVLAFVAHESLLVVLGRLEKTTAGEMVVAAALSSCGLAVALAGGGSLASSIACFFTWVLAFVAATLAVQVVLIRARSKGRSDPGRRYAAIVATLLAGAFAAVPLAGLPGAAPLALAPSALLSAAVCLSRFSPKRLRELGWAMVGSSLLTMALLVAGLR